MNILFLYTELAGYTLACLNALAGKTNALAVVHYPVNNEAPFRFDKNESIEYANRKDFDEKSLLKFAGEKKPDLVFCSGWSDKAYLEACRFFKKEGIPVILCMDNRWKFTLRKVAAVLASPFLIRPYFTAAWVPGHAQAAYALKLGFKKNKIFTGFYCADTGLWTKWFDRYAEEKKNHFPKIILYAGRYYEFKGLPELWDGFAEFKKGQGKEWQLWCAGTGSLEPVQGEGIKHLGFVQPAEMEKLVRECGVFIFPSRFEPWGVAVHEFAAAGFPLLLSSEVGAAEMFLQNGVNGFIFEAGSKNKILEAFNKMSALGDAELFKMSLKSNEIAKGYDTSGWAKKVEEIFKKLKLK